MSKPNHTCGTQQSSGKKAPFKVDEALCSITAPPELRKPKAITYEDLLAKTCAMPEGYTEDMSVEDKFAMLQKHAYDYKAKGNMEMHACYQKLADKVKPGDTCDTKVVFNPDYLNKKFARLSLELKYASFDDAILASRELQQVLNKSPTQPTSASLVVEGETDKTLTMEDLPGPPTMKRSKRKVRFQDDLAETETPPPKKKTHPLRVPSSAGHTPFPHGAAKANPYDRLPTDMPKNQFDVLASKTSDLQKIMQDEEGMEEEEPEPVKKVE